VLDLEGDARAGLSIVDVDRPEEELALSGADGRFELATAQLPLTLEAVGKGWASVCEAQAEAVASEEEALLAVAPAVALRGRGAGGSRSPARTRPLRRSSARSAFPRRSCAARWSTSRASWTGATSRGPRG